MEFNPAMLSFSDTQVIGQLEPQKGGYFFIWLSAENVNRWEKKKATRLICILEDKLSFRCGLNHLGDGNFFIILATRQLEELGKVWETESGLTSIPIPILLE